MRAKLGLMNGGITALRTSCRTAWQCLAAPLLDRLPNLPRAIIPGKGMGSNDQPDMRPMARQRRLEAVVQLIGDEGQRRLSLCHQHMIKPMLCLVSRVGTGKSRIKPDMGQRRLGRIAQQERKGHLPGKPGDPRKRISYIVSHVFEWQRTGTCLFADHRENVLWGRREPRLGREIGKQPAAGSQMVVMHERFAQRIQVARFPRDAFNGCRDGPRMASESVEFHVRRPVAGHVSGQGMIA